MKASVLSLLLPLALSSCCSFGTEVSVREHVEGSESPLLVVYYPEHDTWNTGLLAATIEIVVAYGPVYLRYGAEPYVGSSSQASICYRRLTAVDKATALAEVERLDFIGP